MPNILLPLAQGCEELEAVTIMDLCVRAGIEVTTATLDVLPVVASRGTTIIADTTLEKVKHRLFDMLVLPGGMPAADHLRDSEIIQTMLKQHAANGRYVAAICAAPKALAKAGLLKNKKATAFPGTLEKLALKDTEICDDAIVIDGNIITSRSPGSAMDFSLCLIGLLMGDEKKFEVEKNLYR